MTEQLSTKYRPINLDEVVGQRHIVDSLHVFKSDKKDWPHAFLFTGPSGTGKTTLARIVASELGCTHNWQIIEVDAASYSTKEKMLALIDGAKYRALGKDPTKVYIIDECHALSAAAWQVFLKPLEDAPDHVYFALCTTEHQKVPKTIRTRCHSYDCKPVEVRAMVELLDWVCEQEGIPLDDARGELTDICKASEGSPRQALQFLSMVQESSEESVAEIIKGDSGQVKEVIDLCRLLVRGEKSWTKYTTIINSAKDKTSPEGARIMVVRYFTSVALSSSKKTGNTFYNLFVLDAFSTPYHSTVDGWAPFLCSLGAVVFDTPAGG